MKPSEPFGNPLLAPFFVRITLGGYFVLAGFSKFDYLPDFIRVIEDFGILPNQFATMYGISLPYLEIGVGILILSGLWSTIAGMLGAMLILSYIIGIGLFPYEINRNLFNKDIILLGAALSLMYSGSGAYSIDTLRKSG